MEDVSHLDRGVPVLSVQASARDGASWAAVARRAEGLGFYGLLVPDHPGSRPAPFSMLAAAAMVTSSIRLGVYVSNAGVREPAHLAVEVATLDMLSKGRALLGVGAGHTPAEWAAVGKARPEPSARAKRCADVATVVRALLRGEAVDVSAAGLVVQAKLAGPLPVQKDVPLLVGTSNSWLLCWAGAHADVVGLTGLGRTKPDGHSHEVRWSPSQVEAQVEQVRSGAEGRGALPELEALVQRVEITDDAEAAVGDLAHGLEIAVSDLLACPYVLVGTEAEIITAVAEHGRRYGITRYVVREGDMETIASIFPSS
jgi:probable F420-dependent oxidoreductase